MLTFVAPAQLINLNFTAGTSYTGSSETSPATPSGPAGVWNNISLTAANATNAVTYADGSAGPTLVMDTGRNGSWVSSLTTSTANYTGSGSVYAVPNLYEAGLINGNNDTLGFRLKGLSAGTYTVNLVPIYRGYNANGSNYTAGVHLYIGTGNDTDAKDAGGFTLVTTNARPEQYINSGLKTWVAATDGSTPYNYVTATVTIDDTNRWLTFLCEDAALGPDRPGPAVIQIGPANGVVTSSVPVITQALFTPQGIVLRGVNGPLSSAYQVITSTNISQPASNWTTVAAYSFDSNGHFDSTNPVLAGANQQYFRVLVGGIVPPPPTAPTITNQPQSLTVAVGANPSFSVAATGTAPLSYFWSLNTNTPVGGNSSTLSLNNVQTGDSGSYRVIVTNSVGSATSSVATLTVLVPPSITSNPTNLTVGTGDSAVFSVVAQGSALQYQWFDNTGSQIDGETNASLTLNSIDTTDAGNYSVIVSNAVGAVTSSNAVLTVLGPPIIITPPDSHTATLSNATTFAVEAAGPALVYQWFFNTNTPVGINSNKFVLSSVQISDAGAYNVVVTNNYGAVTSSFAMLTVNTSIVANAEFNLVGFGQNATGGGEISETDPAYVKVTNAWQLANAVLSFNKTGGVKVIEIMNDLDLGWNEIGTNVQLLGSTPFTAAATPKLHPRLIQTGVSKMDIKYKNGGLTIFSANGATIRHCTFNIKSTHNIIVRNLKFDEMWEWDEASKGNYDGNDWDYIDLANGGPVYDIWIDHCTFTKSYDGIVDMKAGSTNVTLSWCRYTGDDGATNPNSFVWQQINSLESNKTSYAMYNFLRNNGFSTTNIVQIIQGHDKTHLMGANSLDSNNANLSCTFHHLWFQNCWDRVVPRLRAGNVHDFNIYVDDATALAAKRLRDYIVTTVVDLNSNSSNAMKNTYSFNPFLNGTISTENGAILVEKSIYNDCLSPLRNNQTDPTDPTYTGKIMALDCVYHFDNADSSTIDYRGDNSTNSPGGTYFGPAQATIIPFSWNGFTNLPYSYSDVLTDPVQLPAVLATSAGAGVLTWDKSNWLKTTY